MSTSGEYGQPAAVARTGNLAITLLAGLGGSIVGALAWVLATYPFMRSGFMLIGLGSFIAAWCVSWAVRRAARGRITPVEQTIAAVGATLAAFGGIIALMWWSTGKSPAVLFSEAERDRTFNTMFNLMQYLSYGIAALCGWFFTRS